MRASLAVLALALAAASVVSAAPGPGLWDSFIDRAREVKDRVVDGAREVKDRVVDAAKDSWDFTKGAVQGSGDMVRAYSDMREANWRDSDRYFHARGNHDAAKRGPGGRWAAEVISNTREAVDRLTGDSAADSARDQEANEWGRNGGDPDRYRPPGLPGKY